MGLTTNNSIPVGDEALTWANHRGDLETGTYVGWISQYGKQVKEVAAQIGWTGDEMSQPFGVEVAYDDAGPNGGGYKVTAGGKTLGYTSRAAGLHKREGKRVARLFVGGMGQACLLLDP